uniref:Uncharacterized protein n=1 Tax=Cynoglossus semilaevis TaxID=244447 RepID=A0A3P8VU85_CYNSE
MTAANLELLSSSNCSMDCKNQHSLLHLGVYLRFGRFEKDPSCLVLTSLSCSSCLCPRRYRYSMCITSVLLMRALTLNSSRIRGTKPGFSRPAWRNCRYRARTCFCSLL